MCGLFGWIVQASRSPGYEELVRLTDLLSHRGPDGKGYELRQTRDGRFSIGLGHRRLSIIDLSQCGAQPMWSADGTQCLIFNGEIYNYIELQKELEALGERFTSTSDTEVLLSALRVWGKDAVPRFRGMFAFALLNTADDTVLLARDSFGKKPLFLGRRGDDVFFSSEIEPIANAPGFDRSFNWDALDGYLLDRYVPGPGTFLNDITKLPPGCLATWKAGRFEIERFYLPPFASTRPDFKNYGEAVKLFGQTFDDAVRIRMRSDAPFGAFLSGGLDSSAVVAAMIRHTREPVRTFSIGFNEHQYSELSYCKIVADYFKTEHQDVVVTAQDFFDHWPEAILRRGAPVSEASDIPMLILSKMASASVKMVLTGEGADELIAGYPKHKAERFSGAYQKIVPALVHDRLVQPAIDRMPYGMRRIKVLAKALGQRASADRFRIWFGGLSPDERDLLLGHAAKRTDASDFPFSIRIGSNLRKSQFFDQTSWLPDNSLERADRMMMAGSVEGRMPFMDTELTALVARMPDSFLIRRGRSKAVLRSAMEGVIPPEILTRPKNGFRVPVNEWFRGSHKGIVRDLLTSNASTVRRILNASFIDQKVEEHIGGRVNNERILWSLCNLEQFIRIYKLELGAVTEALAQ